MHNTTEVILQSPRFLLPSTPALSRHIRPESSVSRERGLNFPPDNPFPSPLAAAEIHALRVGRNHGGPSLVALRVVEGQSHVIRARGAPIYAAVGKKERVRDLDAPSKG